MFNGIAYHQEPDVIKTKQALVQIAGKRILLLGSTKFGITALIRLCTPTEFDWVLADDGPPAHEEGALREAGVKFRIVAVGAVGPPATLVVHNDRKEHSDAGAACRGRAL